MADDGDDDKKEDNKNKGQKEKISDPQALNDIKAIFSRIQATNNPAELRSLANAAQNIKSDNPLIDDIAAKIADYATKKLEIAEKQLISNNAQDLEKQRDSQREEEVIKSQLEDVRRIQEADTLHKEFKKDAEEYKKLSPPMEEMVKKNEKGEEVIDDKAINKNILTEEEIEKRRQKLAELKEKEKKLNGLIEKANVEKKTLEEEIKTLTEQRKDKNLSPEQIKELEKEINARNAKLETKNTLVEKFQEVKQSAQKEIESINAFHQENREKIDKLGNTIEKSKNNLDPNKHQQLKHQHSLLNNQHEAIVNNQSISKEDQGIRKNIRNKIDTQGKIEKMQNALSNSTKQKNNNNQKSWSSKVSTKKTGWER